MSSSDSLRRRLSDLVAADTQNPSGDEAPLVAGLAKDLSALGASRVETFAAGRHRAVLAAFGPSPRVLVNAHVDTVPANSGYTSPPFELTEREGRLYGLGSADTKGAIAAALQAIADRSAAGRPIENTAFLFSGDEECGNTILRFFLESGRARGIERVVVCEPTGCRVGVRHRGIGAAHGVATSPGGHSSRADLMPAPIATLARAAAAIHDWGRERRAEGPRGFEGLCLNVAAIDGGIAFNVVPTRATLTVSFRPWPGADVLALHRDVEERARAAAAPDPIDWKIAVANPPFASRDVGAFAPLLGERAGAPVDLQFWTEAALFSAAGIDAVVFGPGEIAQAHAADEFVHTAQLEEARDVFIRGLP
jgi:acetylornithine deacetylase